MTIFSDFCSGYDQSAERKNLSDSQALEKEAFCPPLLGKVPKKTCQDFLLFQKILTLFYFELIKIG